MKKKVTETINLSEADRQSISRVVGTINQIAEALLRVMPNASEDLVGTVAHDLGDFWEIAENHVERVKEIVQLKGPHDQPRLAELLTDLYYGDLKAHLPNHVESMEEVMPALIELLETGQNKDK